MIYPHQRAPWTAKMYAALEKKGPMPVDEVVKLAARVVPPARAAAYRQRKLGYRQRKFVHGGAVTLAPPSLDHTMRQNAKLIVHESIRTAVRAGNLVRYEQNGVGWLRPLTDAEQEARAAEDHALRSRAAKKGARTLRKRRQVAA